MRSGLSPQRILVLTKEMYVFRSMPTSLELDVEVVDPSLVQIYAIAVSSVLCPPGVPLRSDPVLGRHGSDWMLPEVVDWDPCFAFVVSNHG